MPQWSDDIPFAELQAIAQKLEEAARRLNQRLLASAGLGPDELLPAFIETHAALLRFDEFGKKRLAQAVEEGRVHTLSGGNLFMTCVLSSAIALSEYKKLPRPVQSRFAPQLKFLKDNSTGVPALTMMAFASFYALIGRQAAKKFTTLRSERKRRTLDAPRGKSG